MKIETQLIKYGKPIYEDLYIDEYVSDENGNLYGKTGRRIKVDSIVVGYDFSESEWQEEIKPAIESRVGVLTRPVGGF